MVRQSMPNSRKISSSSHRVRCCASLTALRTSQLLALIGKMPIDQANDSGAHTEHCRSCWIVCMSRNGRGLAYSSDSWGSRCTNCIREPVTKAECHASQVTNVVAWLHHTFSYPNFLLVTSEAGPGRTASHWGRAGSMCSATALQGGRCGDLGVYSEVKRRRPSSLYGQRRSVVGDIGVQCPRYRPAKAPRGLLWSRPAPSSGDKDMVLQLSANHPWLRFNYPGPPSMWRRGACGGGATYPRPATPPKNGWPISLAVSRATASDIARRSAPYKKFETCQG